ncbi:TPR Domain containing protein [Aphelenchoides avenae]|nr:TPR Domain containing protein [Aphelenchus avenae]
MSEANIGSSNSGVNWSRVGMIAGGAAVAATVGFAAYYQLKKSRNTVPPDPSDPRSQEKVKQRAEQLKAKGNEHFGKRDYMSAVKFFSQAIELASQVSPMDVKMNEFLAVLHNNLSAAFEQLGDTDMTVQHCEQAITFNPKYAKALIRRGRSFLKNNKYEDALRDYVEAIFVANSEQQAKALQQDLDTACTAIASLKADKLLEERKGSFLGIAQHDLSNWLWASVIHDPVLNDVNALKGKSVEPNSYEEALQMVNRGRYDKVFPKIENVLNNPELDDTTKAKSVLLSARFLYYHGHNEKARERLKQHRELFESLAENGDNNLRVAYIALSVITAEDNATAKQLADSALECDPQNADAHMSYAMRLLEESDDSQTVDAIKRVMEIEPDHPYAKYYEIYCSFVVAAQAQEIGQMHDHITALEREIAKDSPKVPVFALIFLTKIAMTMQNIELAVETVQKAAQVQPDCSLVKYLRCLLDLDKIAPAAMTNPAQVMAYMEEMKKAMLELQESDPNYWEPLRMLAKYHMDKKDFDQAFEYYDKTVMNIRKKDEMVVVMGELVLAETMRRREQGA